MEGKEVRDSVVGAPGDQGEGGWGGVSVTAREEKGEEKGENREYEKGKRKPKRER